MTQRVAIYSRYSSDRQSEASIEDQQRICLARAEREGWSVVASFADRAISGATRQRPQYQKLLDGIRAGKFDIVLAESLDRFSRDQVDTISLHKQCQFHGVRICTLAEGTVSQTDVGLKGLMGSLYLTELSAKTRRGLAGRILKGRSIAAPPYGYRIVQKWTEAGDAERGLRECDPAKVTIVQRIFQAYADGMSPRQIAKMLNAEGIKGPGGGIWYDSAIRGRPLRADGLLRNELYNGRLVWHRQNVSKDPDTGLPHRRYSKPDEIVRTAVPVLKIIDDDLWKSVQARLAAEAAPKLRGDGMNADHNAAPTAFWTKQRPRHLLSRKVFCGSCGRGLAVFGKDYLGCNAAKHGTCHNTARIRRPILDAQVLQALEYQLMPPELVMAFVASFNEEWKRLVAQLGDQAQQRERDLKVIRQKIANLVDAIGEGRASSSVMGRIQELEAEEERLKTQSQATVTLPPALHPNLANVYAARVKALRSTIGTPGHEQALHGARVLIDRVMVHPPENGDDPPCVEVVGELIELLKAAGLQSTHHPGESNADAAALGLFASSVKEVPGAKPPPFFLLPRSHRSTPKTCLAGVARGG